MKKIVVLLLLVAFVFTLSGCVNDFKIRPVILSGAGAVADVASEASNELDEDGKYFIAQVTEIKDSFIVVKPYQGDWGIELPEEILISLPDLSYGAEMVGNRVFVKTSIRVYYEGDVRENHPAQINAVGIVFEEG